MNTGNMYTTLPGYAVDYDGETVTAVPAMDMQLTNGEVLKPPEIIRVPVMWMTGDSDQALVSVPIKPGDNIIIHFSCRSIENWLSGSDQAPDDPRQFDLSDAFCTPVLRTGGRKADTENVSVEYKDSWMKIQPGGNINMHASADINITAEGNIKIVGSRIDFNP